MSRKGNAIGNRLGISKDWISHFGSLKQAENVKKTLFIYNILLNFLEKLSIWFLDIKIIQKKNILNIYILISYLNSNRPLLKNVFLLGHLQKNWYWESTIINYLRVPRYPKSPWRKSRFKYKKILRILMHKLLYLNIGYRFLFLKILAIYLENYIYNYIKYPIKIYIYNIIDYYSLIDENSILLYLDIFINLYKKDHRSFGYNIKTALFYLCLGIIRSNSYLIAKTFSLEMRKYRRIGRLFKFFFKIIREVFNIMPLINKNGQKIRAEFLRIQISGKINGKMRAMKKIYSFSHYKGKEIPIQTLNLKLNYSLMHCITYAGVLGIKVWVY